VLALVAVVAMTGSPVVSGAAAKKKAPAAKAATPTTKGPAAASPPPKAPKSVSEAAVRPRPPQLPVVSLPPPIPGESPQLVVARNNVIRAKAGTDPVRVAESLRLLAVSLMQAGKTAESLATSREAIAAVEKLPGTPGLAAALQVYGWGLIVSGKPTDAVAHLQRAATLFEADQKVPERAAVLGLLAWANSSSGDYAGAVPILTELVALSRKGTKGVSLPDSLDSLAVALLLSKRGAEALAPANELVTLRQGTQDLRFAGALQTQGWAKWQAGDAAGATVALERALQLRESLAPTDQKGLADVLGLLSAASRDAGKYDRVVTTSQRLVDMARKGVPGIDLAATLESSGVSMMLAKQPEKAVPLLEEALKVRSASGSAPSTPTQLGDLHATLGWAYSSLNKPVEASVAYTTALKYREQVDPNGAQTIDTVRALAALLHWNVPNSEKKALGYYDRYLAWCRARKVPAEQLAGALNDAAFIRLQLKQPLEAGNLAEEAVGLAGGAKTELAANSLLLLGRAKFEQEDFRGAIPSLTRALEIMEKLNLTELAATTSEILGIAQAAFDARRV
jgi:tetratricopeptide (TPR) repeat protein